jgi:hypothetical protein
MPPPKECHTYGLWKRFLITLASIDIKIFTFKFEKNTLKEQKLDLFFWHLWPNSLVGEG